MEGILSSLAEDRDLLNRLRRPGMNYARERLDLGCESADLVRHHALGAAARSEARTFPAQDAAPEECKLILSGGVAATN